MLDPRRFHRQLLACINGSFTAIAAQLCGLQPTSCWRRVLAGRICEDC